MIELGSTDAKAMWPLVKSAFEFTDEGLVWADRVCLARVAPQAPKQTRVAVAEDRDRLLALLSVGANRRVEQESLRHIEVAAKLWEEGDKALANLRLVFADLPRPENARDIDRVSLAEFLLDAGVTPAALTKELGLDAEQPDLEKYWEDQPRVPAGHGRESGRWTGSVDVATVDGPPENEEQRKEDHVLPGGRPQVTVSGGRIFEPTDGMLTGAGSGKEFVAKAVAAAAKAKQNVGPGRGPVYGTAVHTEFKRIIGELKDPAMHAEQSYLDGFPVDHGTPGSIRLDCVAGSAEEPTHFVDLKTGSSRWTPARERQVRLHLPLKCKNKPAYVVRP